MAQVLAARGPGLDRQFSGLARQIPGFGGMYYDKAGKLNIFVKPVAGARSTDVVSQLRTFGGVAMQRRLQRNPAIVVQEAQYDFSELQTLKSRLTRIFKVPGVVFTDIDEAKNRVGLGITPNADQGVVEAALKTAGVPLEAVSFTRIPPIQKMKTLTQKFPNAPGGAQIFFPSPSEGFAFICSLGFNAQLPDHAGNFFVTASHCSDIQGGNQHTQYFQPQPGTGSKDNLLAVEFKDPSYGTAGGNCYVGFRCRLSDALLARYRASVRPDFGTVARTTFGLQRIGSKQIDPANPRWNILGSFPFPFEGETAHKVGRTTGWTTGPVIFTCVDFQEGGSDIVEICQDVTAAGVGGGDSGSPVFERADDFTGGDTSDIILIGILWGGGTLFDGTPIFISSAMENIEQELGPLFVN